MRYSLNMTENELVDLIREIEAQDRAYVRAAEFDRAKAASCETHDDCENCESESEFIERAKWRNL